MGETLTNGLSGDLGGIDRPTDSERPIVSPLFHHDLATNRLFVEYDGRRTPFAAPRESDQLVFEELLPRYGLKIPGEFLRLVVSSSGENKTHRPVGDTMARLRERLGRIHPDLRTAITSSVVNGDPYYTLHARGLSTMLSPVGSRHRFPDPPASLLEAYAEYGRLIAEGKAPPLPTIPPNREKEPVVPTITIDRTKRLWVFPDVKDPLFFEFPADWQMALYVAQRANAPIPLERFNRKAQEADPTDPFTVELFRHMIEPDEENPQLVLFTKLDDGRDAIVLHANIQFAKFEGEFPAKVRATLLQEEQAAAHIVAPARLSVPKTARSTTRTIAPEVARAMNEASKRPIPVTLFTGETVQLTGNKAFVWQAISDAHRDAGFSIGTGFGINYEELEYRTGLSRDQLESALRSARQPNVVPGLRVIRVTSNHDVAKHKPARFGLARTLPRETVVPSTNGLTLEGVVFAEEQTRK